MKSKALFLLAIFACQGHAAVDFTPTQSTREQDGIIFPQLFFKQDGQQISYEQPTGWKYRGDSSRIAFAPPNVAQAEAAIEQALLPAPQNFDDPTVKLLKQQVIDSVPKNSLHIEVASEEKNPLMPNGHETYEVVVTYQISGIEFERSILFLNLPDTQLRFCVTAHKQDFEKIHNAFRASIFSWQWL
jgi:hypothetical protein